MSRLKQIVPVHIILGVCFFIAATSVAAHADEPEAFAELSGLPNLPGAKAVASPNGRYVLRAIPGPAGEYPLNRLVIEAPETHQALDLMGIDRNIDVGWREDSELFFLNENYASNSSDCEIFKPFETHPMVSIAGAVAEKLQLFSDSEKADVSHLYFSCVRWISHTAVAIVVYGHYDMHPGFRNRHLVYDVAARRFDQVK